MISYPLQKSTYLVLAIFNRIVFGLELFQTNQNWQVRHLYPLRCGCYPYLLTYVLTYLLDWHSNPEFVMLQIASLEEALTVIEGMRAKYYCRGQQIIAYRKKVRQQVGPDSRFLSVRRTKTVIRYSNTAAAGYFAIAKRTSSLIHFRHFNLDLIYKIQSVCRKHEKKIV